MIQNQKIDDLQERLSKIKLVAFDVDGVMTNGEIIYSESGEELKIFNAKDGHGAVMLNRKGFITAIITARQTPIVDRRAKDLDITHVYQGAKNKLIALQDLMEKYNLDFSQIAYVGDDMPDVCILERVGLAFCPNDSAEEVKKICHFISSKDGGKGAVREISDFILSGIKDKTLEKLAQ
jgi:3-deoxy-D-manno-octulosonate 8-phosphate phosphatase (KDO 8-P phosphatase)